MLPDINSDGLCKIKVPHNLIEKIISKITITNHIILKMPSGTSKFCLMSMPQYKQYFSCVFFLVRSASTLSCFAGLSNEFKLHAMAYQKSNFKKAFVSLKEGSEIQFEGVN